MARLGSRCDLEVLEWSMAHPEQLGKSESCFFKKNADGDASYTCLSAGIPSVRRRGKQRKRGAKLAEGRKLYEASPR